MVGPEQENVIGARLPVKLMCLFSIFQFEFVEMFVGVGVPRPRPFSALYCFY